MSIGKMDLGADAWTKSDKAVQLTTGESNMKRSRSISFFSSWSLQKQCSLFSKSSSKPVDSDHLVSIRINWSIPASTCADRQKGFQTSNLSDRTSTKNKPIHRSLLTVALLSSVHYRCSPLPLGEISRESCLDLKVFCMYERRVSIICDSYSNWICRFSLLVWNAVAHRRFHLKQSSLPISDRLLLPSSDHRCEYRFSHSYY
jgi:hypothetical protein